MEKEVSLSEPQASCGHFPFFDLHMREPAGQRSAVAFLCFLFFGEAKKGSSRRSTTGQQFQINAIGHSQQKNQQQASPPRNTHAPYRHSGLQGAWIVRDRHGAL